MLEKIKDTISSKKEQRRRRKKMAKLLDEKQVERNMRVNGIRPKGPDFHNRS